MNPKNVVECILIKRRTGLGALDIKRSVRSLNSELAALNKDAATWHRVYAARRAAPRAAPDVDLAAQTEEQDRGPLLGMPFGAAMDSATSAHDDRRRGGARARDGDWRRGRRGGAGRTGGPDRRRGHRAPCAAKKALIRAEDQSEQVLGDDPGDAHVLLSSTNAFAGIPSANACSINDEKTRSVLDKLLKPAGVRSCWLSPGGSEHADRVRPAPTIGQAFGADDEADDADEEGVLPPLIYRQDGCVTKKGSIAVVKIESKSRERDNGATGPGPVIAIRDCCSSSKIRENAECDQGRSAAVGGTQTEARKRHGVGR